MENRAKTDTIKVKSTESDTNRAKATLTGGATNTGKHANHKHKATVNPFHLTNWISSTAG
jgi:hypothetical protein